MHHHQQQNQLHPPPDKRMRMNPTGGQQPNQPMNLMNQKQNDPNFNQQVK